MDQPAASARFAFPALILANVFLAFGPWMVRLADVGPAAAAFWRLLLAMPVLLLLARLWESTPFRAARGTMMIITLAGLFFAADLAAWHMGILRTKLANATLLGNCSSLIFPLYGFLVARRCPQRPHALALLLALVGVALLLGRSYELSPKHLGGDLLALLAGAFYTGYLIAIDQARRSNAAMPVLALATAASMPPLLVLALLLGETIMPGNWTPLILLSLGSQLIGQGLLVYAIGHVSPLVVGVTLLTQPAVAALIGWVTYDERLALGDAVGALLIGFAMVLIRLPARLDSGQCGAHLGGEGEPHDNHPPGR